MKRGIVRSVGVVAAVAAVLAAVGVPLVEATSTPAGATATACSAATKTWTGGAGTANWDDANNWSPAGAPGTSSIACIPSTASVAQVNLSSSVTVQAVEADRPLNLSGTLSVSSASIISSISSGTLTGNLAGAGATTISGSLIWGPNGGLTGSGTTTIEPGTTVTVTGDDAVCGGGCSVGRSFDEDGTLVNEGTIAFPDETSTRYMDSCGAFDNKGTVELNDNVFFESECSPGDTIDNAGTITKAAGTGSATIQEALDNEGTVSASSGELDLSGGTPSSVSSSGTFRADSPGTLDIDGSQSWNGAQSVGTGTVDITGTVTDAGTVSLDTGTTLTGNLAGAGATTISGSLIWGPNGGLTGSGTTTIEPGTTVTVTGDDAVCGGGCSVGRSFDEDGTLVNEGTIAFPDETSTRYMDSCGAFDNKGTVELNDNVFFESECSPGDTIDNAGTITKAAGTGSATIQEALDNEGTVSASSGELDLSGGTPSSVSSSGTFRADSPGTLDIDGSQSWNGAQSVGTGTVDITGTVTDAGTVSLDTGTTLTGNLAGAGATTISGSLIWGPNGGLTGSGTTTIEPGTTVTVTGDDAVCGGGCSVGRSFDEDGTLVNEGTIAFPDETSTRYMDSCGAFDNKGTVELNDNVFFESECSPGDTIDNAGTITKAAGTGSAIIQEALDNEGTVSVGASDGGHGTLDLSDLSNYDSSGTTLSGGTFAAIHGGNLQLENVGTVTTTNAVVDVDGAGSSVVGSSSTPVLSSLSTIGLQGGITLRNGQSLTTPGALHSAGTVRLGPSSSLSTTGSYTQTQGTTELEDPTASLTATGGQVIMDAGTFSGPGTVSPALNVVGGTLHPGADPSTLAVSGPATVAAGASMTGVVDGTAAAQYDRLAATGALAVGGSLTLSRGPDYSPTNGDSFTVASGSSRTGTFANVTQDLSFAGWYFTPTYTSTSAGVTIHRVSGPDVIATATATGSAFDIPVPGSWTVNVENAGSAATSGPVSVQTTLGSGQSLQSSSGHGWSCSGTTTVTCTTSASAASGTSFAPITLTVGLTTAAQPSTTLALSVSGGGDAYTGDNTFSASVPVQNVPAPNAALGISSTRGSDPFTVEFDGTGSTGATSYSWDFGDGNNSTAAQPAHTYLSPGVYTVTLRVDNAFMSDTASTQVTVLANVPLTADAGDNRTVTTSQTVSFDGSSSQPVGGIDSYAWDFGGGSTASGATATHSWSTPGDYPVTLTVTHGSQTDSDTITVHVVLAPGSGLAVTVSDGSNPVSGASAVVLDAQGNHYAATSASNGVATVTGLSDGTYSLYVFAPGYEPQVVQATVANGAGSVAVTLSAGSVGTTSVTSEPMTYDQIVAAGIDPNDPDNQNVLNFTICLAFDDSSCVPFTGDVNQVGEIFSGSIGGGGGGGTCTETSCVYDIPAGEGGGEAIATVEQIGGEPTAMILRIPGQAKWLKEFFDVQMAVVNLAPAGFTFTDGAATLDIPTGLSLAPTPTPQTATIQVPDVAGGQSQEVSWIVRGDAEGFYNLHAHYGATLDPIGASVDLDAQTGTPLHVWGLSAVNLQVTADDAAVAHEPYRIHVDMTNVTSGADATPIYNPTLELDQNAGGNQFIFEPDEQFSQGTAELDPGQTFGADYVIIPTFSGTLNPAGSVTFLDTGAAEEPTTPVTSQPRVAASHLSATASGKNLDFTWAPVSGSKGYRLYVTPSDTTPFGDGSLVKQYSASKKSASIPLPLGTHWYTISTEDASGVWTTHHQLIEYANPASQPKVTSLSKTSGAAAGGNSITVTGKNLKGATGVLFGTTAGTKVKANAKGTSVSVVVPAHATGTVDVTVVTPNGTTPVTNADRYKYK